MKCEMCGWVHREAIICEKCGFFMHYHDEGHQFDYYNKYFYPFYTIYPFLNKKIANCYNKMHIKIQSK
jgi:hypothetical protein